MLCPPNGLDHDLLRTTLREQYNATETSLEFVPVGEDSWGYRAGELWVSVRRDLRGHVPAAYEAATLLRRAGLDFVLAPLRGRDGRVVRHVGDYPIVVFPFLVITPLADAVPEPSEVATVREQLARVHASRVAADLPAEDFVLPFKADLDLALAVPNGAPPVNGPYGERLHRLLTRHREYLAALCREYEDLAATCAAAPGAFVLTHGEPIASNLFRHGDRLLIADWGDARRGPPERDWSHVARTLGGDPAGRPAFLRLYDIRWILSEIAEYTRIFVEPHTGGADDVAMWGRLVRYLPDGI